MSSQADRQGRFWLLDRSDRVLSPVVALTFAMPLYGLEIAIWRGDRALAVESISMLAVLLGSPRLFELGRIRRIEDQLAACSALKRWISFKRRFRAAGTRYLPAVRRTAIILLASYATVFLPAAGQASLGLPLPNLWAGLVSPGVGYALFLVHTLLAFASVLALMISLALSAAWGEAAEPELHVSPLVPSDEVAQLLRKEPAVLAPVALLMCCLVIGLFTV